MRKSLTSIFWPNWSKTALMWLLVAMSSIVLTACNQSSPFYTSLANNPQGARAAVTTTNLQARTDGDLQIVKFLPPPPSAGAQNDVRISENDLLQVDVFQVDDLDREVSVQSDGSISMPLIGKVKAGGLTLAQLEQSLKARYGRNHLQNPEISVFMKESAGQRVTMDGQFVKPGIYSINSRSSLLQTVAQAGGLTELADEKKLYVYRTYPDGKRVANFSVEEIRKGKTRDPQIYGSDVIVAFTSSSKVARQNLKEALGVAVTATRIASPL